MHEIGVFGAAFNPPTLGHRDVIMQAKDHFNEILLVPSFSHAFGKNMLAIEHRLAMLALFIADLPKRNFPSVTISSIEETLFQKNGNKGPVYTFDVLSALASNYQDKSETVKLSFILGPDNSAPSVWQKFYRYQDIEKNWSLFIAKENLHIHSTNVRELCKNGAPISQLTPLVGDKVAHYIKANQLYREKENRYG